MPYLTTKHKTIAGRSYRRGEMVDVSTLTLSKLASLVRVGLLVVADAPETAGLPPMVVAPPETPEVVEAPAPALPEVVEGPKRTDPQGTMCPVCGEGPYTRLDLHARVHTARVAEEESHEHGD